MMTAVRQTATVQAGGRLELAVPELTPGTVAEVIVLVPSGVQTSATPNPDVADRLAALDELQRSVQLPPNAAAAWAREIRAERDAWPDRGEAVKP